MLLPTAPLGAVIAAPVVQAGAARLAALPVPGADIEFPPAELVGGEARLVPVDVARGARLAAVVPLGAAMLLPVLGTGLVKLVPVVVLGRLVLTPVPLLATA